MLNGQKEGSREKLGKFMLLFDFRYAGFRQQQGIKIDSTKNIAKHLEKMGVELEHGENYVG